MDSLIITEPGIFGNSLENFKPKPIDDIITFTDEKLNEYIVTNGTFTFSTAPDPILTVKNIQQTYTDYVTPLPRITLFPPTDEMVAYHEAAHYVAVKYFRPDLPVDYIKIGGIQIGCLMFVKGFDAFQDITEKTMVGNMYMYAAGEVAESILTGEDVYRLGSSDDYYISDSFGKLMTLLSLETACFSVDDIRKATKAFLLDHWSEIEEIANKVLEERLVHFTRFHELQAA